MKCRVCGIIYPLGCLCGFCDKCIKKYGHDNCFIKAKENEKESEK